MRIRRKRDYEIIEAAISYEPAEYAEHQRRQYPDAEVRVFPRTVRAGGALIEVSVVVVRRLRKGDKQ